MQGMSISISISIPIYLCLYRYMSIQNRYRYIAFYRFHIIYIHTCISKDIKRPPYNRYKRKRDLDLCHRYFQENHERKLLLSKRRNTYQGVRHLTHTKRNSKYQIDRIRKETPMSYNSHSTEMYRIKMNIESSKKERSSPEQSQAHQIS